MFKRARRCYTLLSLSLSGRNTVARVIISEGGDNNSRYTENEVKNAVREADVLYYTSTNEARDGKYRHVTVKLVQPRGLPPLKAFFRLGYYAPSQ